MKKSPAHGKEGTNVCSEGTSNVVEKQQSLVCFRSYKIKTGNRSENKEKSCPVILIKLTNQYIMKHLRTFERKLSAALLVSKYCL